MYEPKIKVYFILFFVMSMLCLCLLVSEAKKIPKSDPQNWEECEGYIIESTENKLIISYQENGNIHYYFKQYLPGTEIDKNETIKLFYYKDNPEEAVEKIYESYSIIVIFVAIITMYFVGMTIFCYRYITISKNGKRVQLKIVDYTPVADNTGGVVYRFVWQKENKIKYLTDPFRTYAYKEIIDLCGITDIYCYVRNENSRYCYADFEGTFEENNISLSMAKRATNLK